MIGSEVNSGLERLLSVPKE